jgi:DNA modification methylase
MKEMVFDFYQDNEKESNGASSENEKSAEKGVHPQNKLNNLTGKEWIRFTKSWFIHNPPPRSHSQIEHPAKFPEAMVEEFIEYFTKTDEIVLDPFMGVGSTVLAAVQHSRKAIGIELNKKYFELSLDHIGLFKNACTLINDDASRIPEIWKEKDLPIVDFIMTSPPYWDMLAHSRGNVFSTHKERKAKGLDVVYSERDERDLGNISDYKKFLKSLANVFKKTASVLREGKYMVIVIQNLRAPEGRMMRLAWSLAEELDKFLVFKGEKIWCQDNKKLGIWGYPNEFVLNVHHHYCLVFKKS